MDTVLEQFGQAETIARSLKAAWRRGENKEIVMKKRIIFSASLVTVSLAAAWLTFCAVMIGRTLFPTNQFLIHASEGSRFAVRQGVVQVLAAGSNGTGVEHFNTILLPFLVVPFILIVGFAVVGCCSLLRPRRVA